MLYRRINHTDVKLSILGFGCMRQPQAADCRIDVSQVTKMVKNAIDHAVNYLDTAYVYHNGESEPFLGRVLSDRYREKVYLATKLPVWEVQSQNDMDRILNEQLSRLNTNHIDFYLLHGLCQTSWILRIVLALIWRE